MHNLLAQINFQVVNFSPNFGLSTKARLFKEKETSIKRKHFDCICFVADQLQEVTTDSCRCLAAIASIVREESWFSIEVN